MVGRDHAGAGIARELAAVDEIQDGVAGAEFQDRAPMRAFAGGVAQGAGAAQDRRDVERRAQSRCGSLAAANTALRFFFSRFSAQRDEFDHALVSLARVVAEGEDAVLVEDQAFDFWVVVEHLGGLFGEPEARHAIGHEAEPPADRPPRTALARRAGRSG